MAQHVVVGDLRVLQIERKDGRRSWTIVWPEGPIHTEADRFLRLHEGSGTQKTYAYYLVDHLRWLDRECLTFAKVALRDLERYMGIVGAEVRMPLGEPWRVGKRPYGHSALSTAAACLKGFYLHQASLGVNGELGKKLDASRLPSRVDRRRSFLGHVKSALPTNPLAPRGPHRRHPKMLPDNARERLLATVNSARDRLTVTWLADGGLRIGELCEQPWRVEGGMVTGGLVKRVSPAMVHTYFEYLTTEYPRETAGHGMLLVQLHGADAGQPWAPVAARRMLGRAAARAGLGLIRPHAFRHSFTSAVLDACGGNLLIARDAGGWASTAMVDEIYGHVDVHDPAFDAALRTVWGEAK